MPGTQVQLRRPDRNRALLQSSFYNHFEDYVRDLGEQTSDTDLGIKDQDLLLLATGRGAEVDEQTSALMRNDRDRRAI